ncbi:MAG: TetR/AcrR family transcriptional regulator [Actinomycetota bacterium]|jgi:AcrR family transcriptional regulator|nr:TetR/AcrR family transcriptional regulator [Actinomycetota bacterium]
MMRAIDAPIPPRSLPLAGGAPANERADAARNRLRILEAAERLFAEHGPQNVSMDEVARAAGVGKGTLFRRFGDRASLARAVLSTHEAAFQEAIIRGAPPLGPGAPTSERLIAFGRGMLGLVDAHRELLLAAETGKPSGKFRSGPYASYRFFVSSLLREAAPRLDPDYTADALLATLGAGFVAYLREDREMPLEQVAAGFEDLVRSLVH